MLCQLRKGMRTTSECAVTYKLASLHHAGGGQLAVPRWRRRRRPRRRRRRLLTGGPPLLLAAVPMAANYNRRDSPVPTNFELNQEKKCVRRG